jgi:dTDP-4-dehydrorhamnose reductase
MLSGKMKFNNKKNMKIGIIGGNGMLGKDLSLLLTSRGFELSVFCYPEYDITKEVDLHKITQTTDIIINCAAYTAVDKAEIDIEECYAINAEAVGKLGQYSAEAGKYLIHVSTDFVFGNNAIEPLNEDSPTNPVGVYGTSKLEGELLLKQTGVQHSIIRIEWTYGVNGENFISKILSLASRSDELKVVNDQVGSPTSTLDVAKVIFFFIENKVRGLFHFAAKGYVSRYEVACNVFDILGVKKNIIPCSSSIFPTPAKRPLNSRFDCSKIDKILDYERPFWKDSLKKYLCCDLSH